MDIFVKSTSLTISPKTTIKEVKNMLEARGLTNPRIIFGNGEILSPVVFQTNQYDNVDFTGHANVLAGSYVLTEPKQKLETVPTIVPARVTAPTPILTPLTPLPPLPAVLTTPTTPLPPLPAVLTTPTTPLPPLNLAPLPPLQPVQPQPVQPQPVQPQPVQQDLINMKTGNYFPTTPISYSTIRRGGDNPFSVSIVGNRVTVQSTLDQRTYLNFTASKIFVGISPINELTGVDEPKFIGNSFVLQNMKDADMNLYWFVGDQILQFSTFKPLIYFTSFMAPDNYNYNYPWALDEDGNVYLFNDKVILMEAYPPDFSIEEKDRFDPYTIFSEELLQFEFEDPITGEIYKMTWDPNPEERYYLLTEIYGGAGRHTGLALGKDKWVETIRQYGIDKGLEPMVITNRLVE